MIKFRCPNCTQKIAVDDEGADRVIACPTCMTDIVVPPETAVEFLPAGTGAAAVPLELLDSGRGDPSGNGSMRGIDPRLAPWVERLLASGLVRAWYAERAQLAESLDAATREVLSMESRLDHLQEQWGEQLNACHKEISTLRRKLATKEEENRTLVVRRPDALPRPSPSRPCPVVVRVAD